MTFDDKPIESSPFFTEVYDPLQVQIGALPKEFIVGIENTLEIHTDKAGNAPLEVIITSPSGINGKNSISERIDVFFCVLLVPYKIDDTLTIKRVRFTPIEIGLHCLNVKFGSDAIPGRIKFMINFQSFSFKRYTNEIDGE